MKASEVRAMSVAELNTKLDALKKDLFMLRMQHATNQLDNPQKLVQTKRDIARVKTMIREKEEKKHGREENFITSFLCHSLYRFIEIPIPTSSLYPDTFFLKM